MRRPSRLALWMNGIPVGYWDKHNGEDRLAYLPAWPADPQGRPLSLSLPFTPGNQPYRGARVRDYFDNLLPDSENIRRRLAMRYRAQSLEPFDLLAELGRDCVGAIQLLPADEAPDGLFTIRARPLSTVDIAAMLRHTAGAFPGQHGGEEALRLSIAGAQEKTALLWHEGQWCLPEGNTPTTHIFKLPLGLVGNMQADMRTSIENEWLCAQLLEAWGIPVARTQMAQFEEQKALIVERFDRRLSGDGQWWLRLPQEDMCQALGVSPLRKYQSDGGPGIGDIMTLLSRSENAQADRAHFFRTQIIFWILAATDGHAKNFSIAHLPGNQYHLTPLYDVLSAWPVIGPGHHQIAWQKCKLAMAVRGSSNYYHLSQIRRRHWLRQGELAGLSAAQVNAMIDELIASAPAVIARVADALTPDFPAFLAGAIFDGMRQQCARLLAA
ncbi:type II toxin-antitoxin system HipA family toxin [Cronobacter turicensis]|uniref:type II toxin-antitoxin system HipA family toxin n=1 Tax=Cronobacter turicensis TaxID=413502 RepID=UPI001DE11C21|nr:type II toxin-antitoxin system HipA family toxin [Cronobacter turicensis]EGT4493800.1 type II toxin-antitoxin system HipA family toxin [Cronobacter turicensis]EKM0439715.1 type II toxin-antitoxin system HipA family toxin [Cronobacter turicensis]ELY4323417.1 type II toxin-antitoxin system HipA family toxin [Cronobacter turicensis]ELY5944858.1 type II toxin-antitoxin system HipA family toxin [Cronobacter turicensis]ELY5965922.1 type II toxin-antitoxin system HipA family toxin [Cronobacter tur